MLLAGSIHLLFLNSVLQEELIKGLLLHVLQNLFLGSLGDLLLLDGHMDLEFSGHFLLLHPEAELNSLFFRAITRATITVMINVLVHFHRHLLTNLLDSVVDVGVTTGFHLLLGSLELLGRTFSFLKNSHLDLMLVSLNLRLTLLHALHVIIHVFVLHELTADNGNLCHKLIHSYLRYEGDDFEELDPVRER